MPDTCFIPLRIHLPEQLEESEAWAFSSAGIGEACGEHDSSGPSETDLRCLRILQHLRVDGARVLDHFATDARAEHRCRIHEPGCTRSKDGVVFRESRLLRVQRIEPVYDHLRHDDRSQKCRKENEYSPVHASPPPMLSIID